MSNHLFDALSKYMQHSDKGLILKSNGTSFTYKTFFDQAAKTASFFISMGIVPGDRIAVIAHKSIYILATYIASIQCGAVFLPLNPAYTAHELRHFLSDADPALFIADDFRLESLASLLDEVGIKRSLSINPDGSGTLGERAQQSTPLRNAIVRKPEDLAAILYTSGTTGTPKGAMLSHKALLANASALAEIWHFSSDDILLHALPIFHLHGLFVAINITFISGSSLLFLEKFDTKSVLESLPYATVMMGVPTFYTRLLGCSELSSVNLENFRLFISGSAPLLAETHQAWERRTGHAIIERYGMTETNIITSNPYNGPRIPGTVGKPLPETHIRICDIETGSEVTTGKIGVLEIYGPGLLSGYWQIPDMTRRAFRDDGYFITGDLARTTYDGYLILEGRSHDLIISGGLNVYPKEVEAAFNAFPNVAECAVIGTPHPDFGEGVIAIIITDPDTEISRDNLNAFVSKQLATYKRPKQIYFVKSLPRNSMGKVEKNVLRKEYKNTFSA